MENRQILSKKWFITKLLPRTISISHHKKMKRIIVVLLLLIFMISNEAMATDKKLKKYHQKRHFQKTTEPRGGKHKDSKTPIFVIQKHKARSLHFDFRLENDGVLLSWAVPKGPSMNPREKRLAVHTEDHPLEYAKFEGVIPEGQYGAGPVMIWDYGTYKNIKKKDDKVIPMSTCLKKGQIEVFLKGKRLKGAYALVRMKKNNWLLIKMNDDYADARRNPVSVEKRSTKSGRTMTEIIKDNKKTEPKKKKS